MILTQLGNKQQQAIGEVKNADTVSIPAGSPVAFVYNGTDDGIAVVLPATALAAKASSFLAGVAPQAISVGAIGKVIAYGLCFNAKLTFQTRATSTDSFSSAAALSVGAILGIDTIGNGFTTLAASAGQTGYLPSMVLAQSLAAAASSTASAVTSAFSTATAVTSAVKVFVRCM